MKIYEIFNIENRKIMGLLRRISLFNRQENEVLHAELAARFKKLQEINSQDVYIGYYIPLAVKELICRKKAITNESLKALATKLLVKDIASGDLDEFYNFVEK